MGVIIVMYDEAGGISRSIRILVNDRYEIQFASIQIQKASQYLKKFRVFDQLDKELPIEYNLDDYCISIDKVCISNQDYYLITAAPRHPQCKNCKEILMDTTTGLYNRNFWEQIKNEINLFPRTCNFSLIIIDVDNMKAINDVFGHLTGDRVIEIVGQAIKNNIRENRDIGIRYGGDEFIVLLPNNKQDTADKVIERIRKDINRRALEEKLNIQVSVGVAHNQNLVDLEEMIKRADKDLYKEKEIKKDRKIKMYNLMKQIAELRIELDRREMERNNSLSSLELLRLSERINKLIEKYLESV